MMTPIRRPVPRPSRSGRRRFLTALPAAVVLAAGAWIHPARAAGERPVIGVSLLTLANPFFRELGEAIREEAGRHGFDVVVVSGDFDAARQRSQVADFIVRKVAAVVLSPCDSRAVGTAIQQANLAAIPVFTVDIASLGTGKVVSHVATDNLGGGRLAAQALVEAVGGRGKVAILDHPEVESVILRTRGFEEELARLRAEQGVTVEVVARLPGGAEKDRSFKATEDLLQSHPDLAGIFAINDPSALGAVAALEKAGRLAAVKVVGFDGMPEGRQAIAAGRIHADPVQFPDRIGRSAVDQIRAYLDGEEVQPEVLIPTALLRQADALRDADRRP